MQAILLQSEPSPSSARQWTLAVEAVFSDGLDYSDAARLLFQNTGRQNLAAATNNETCAFNVVSLNRPAEIGDVVAFRKQRKTIVLRLGEHGYATIPASHYELMGLSSKLNLLDNAA